ncbi:hypothetical protein CACET_c03890 [Clostridium aceticum]|uniref:Uncharacterized protein n=1 Tax=Clostridium aceticum TaxID=84022 RepID=A0A0D8IEK1_9CLOT|nr:hypothetical protein [Clostridium aceticum]AKL93905.1 hypothetical protein CACET_c03890 [Clostridium aceticum]KJF28703.1 hypothetical protein TZ02_02045 [Clostridium aceticum]
MSDCAKGTGLLGSLCGGGGPVAGIGQNSLLFFFLLLVIIFCNSPCFKDSGDSLLFFFLILVVLFTGGNICRI